MIQEILYVCVEKLKGKEVQDTRVSKTAFNFLIQLHRISFSTVKHFVLQPVSVECLIPYLLTQYLLYIKFVS